MENNYFSHEKQITLSVYPTVRRENRHDPLTYLLVYDAGNELEKLAAEAGFSEAKFYEIGAGFMGNLVATR